MINGKVAKNKNAKELNLSFKSLKFIPKEISDLTNIEVLNFSGNDIKIVEGLDQLIKLSF